MLDVKIGHAGGWASERAHKPTDTHSSTLNLKRTFPFLWNILLDRVAFYHRAYHQHKTDCSMFPVCVIYQADEVEKHLNACTHKIVSEKKRKQKKKKRRKTSNHHHQPTDKIG